MAIRYLEDNPAPAKSRIRYVDEPAKSPDAILPAKKDPSAYGGSEGIRKLSMGGMAGYGSVSGSEDILPAVGQAVGSLGGFAGSVAGATAGQGARQGIRALRGSNVNLAEIPLEAARTVTLEGLSRGASRAVPGIANRMMNSVLRPAKNVLKRNPKFGLDALESGVTGTRAQMIEKAEGLVSGGETALQKILKNKVGNVNPTKIARELGDIKRPFANVGDDASVDAVKMVQRNLRGKGRSLSLPEANQLKRDLYKVVKDTSYGKGVGEITSKQTAMKATAGKLKRAIEAVAPETQAVNKTIGVGVTAKEALENELANSQRRVILPKLAGMGAGGLALSGNLPAAVGVLAGDAGFEALRSPWMVTGTAKNLMRSRKLAKPLALTASEVARRLRG